MEQDSRTEGCFAVVVARIHLIAVVLAKIVGLLLSIAEATEAMEAVLDYPLAD